MANAKQLNGWISLHRKFLSWQFFDDSDAVKLFVYLLLKATPNEFVYNGKIVGIGQFITSYRELEKETKISFKKIRILLGKFREEQIIDIQTNNHYSVIEILNYKTYQKTHKKTAKIMENQNGTQKGTQKGTQNGTRKPLLLVGFGENNGTQKGTQKGTQNGTRINNNINNDFNNSSYVINQSIEKQKFLNLCFEFSEQYSQIMIQEFIEYWTQENENGICKYEEYIQKNQIFDIKQRLFYWSRKAKRIAEQKSKQQTITPEMAMAAQYAINR